MKLNEIKELYPKKVQPWMYQTKDEIEHWISDVAHIRGMVGKELTIHCSEQRTSLTHYGITHEILIQNKGKWVFPVQFEQVINFDIDDAPIESFIGCPYSILENFNFQRVKVTDFKYFPKVVGKCRGSSYHDIKNFKGLDNRLREFSFRCLNNAKIKSLEGLPEGLDELDISYVPIADIYNQCPNLTTLGITRFNGLESIPLMSIFKFKKMKTFWSYADTAGSDMEKAWDIVTEHLKSGRNFNKCKSELIEAGLDEFAQL